jgi:hypothetical protein
MGGTQASFIAQWTDRRASLTRWRKGEGLRTNSLVLEHVLLDTPNLSQVLTVFNNAAKAGIKLTTQTFSEYVARLVEQAQVLTQLTPAHVTLALLAVLTSPNFCSMITSPTHLHTKLMYMILPMTLTRRSTL